MSSNNLLEGKSDVYSLLSGLADLYISVEMPKPGCVSNMFFGSAYLATRNEITLFQTAASSVANSSPFRPLRLALSNLGNSCKPFFSNSSLAPFRHFFIKTYAEQ